MTFDNSRFTFNPLKDYCGVVMEQGRVQLDSDWNEWLAELNRRIQAGTFDIMGQAVYPATTPYAFQITATTGPNAIMIGPGRMYVDGLLVENHGDPSAAKWDPALAELSDTPQPAPQPPLPPPPAPGSIDYAKQPHPPVPLPTGSGPFLAYLDVWTRPVTWLQDSNLIDAAVNVDTTGRMQTMWQVRLMPVPTGTTCGSLTNWQPAPSAGLLSTLPVQFGPSGPCCMTDSTGYTGMQNQFYRTEIQQPGVPATGVLKYPLPLGIATFKWSRDNGSVMTGVTGITSVTNSAGNPASQLTVLSLGRDQTLSFAPGDWIEILDDNVEFSDGSTPGRPAPGELCQIDTVDPSGPTITLTTTLTLSFPSDPSATHTRIIRWDQAGQVYQTDGVNPPTPWIDLGASNCSGDIPVPPHGTWLILENGIRVAFDVNPAGGSFLTGDFWTFAARAAAGSVEELNLAPPRGIHHHYAALSIVDFIIPSTTDCRIEWPPASTCECSCCCTYTVGTGGQYRSIQAALQALPNGTGEICILPGIYYEHIFVENMSDVYIHGCSDGETRIASPSLNTGASTSGGTTTAGTSTTIGAQTPIAAVITVCGSQHIKLSDLAVEAADGEVGILLDGTGSLGATPPSGAPLLGDPTVLDTTIEDLVLTASTMPAVLAQNAALLRVDTNRIAMKNVHSQWPAVWVSNSAEVHIDGNWVGIQPSSTDGPSAWIPATVAADLQAQQSSATSSGSSTAFKKSAKSASASTAGGSATSGPKTSATAASPATSSGATSGVRASAKSTATDSFLAEAVINVQVPIHPGGIQIGDNSRDVFIFENDIDGGALNGITLGSFTALDAGNDIINNTIGVLLSPPDTTSTTVSLVPNIPAGFTGQIVFQNPLLNIQIARNRIHGTGLCGIGPVGLFDLATTQEVITIEGLSITDNDIEETLRGSIAPITTADVGYGAIGLPDVQNLVIRDNTVTTFGIMTGLEVCGIYILHGEKIEISRNQILDVRDWSEGRSGQQSSFKVRGGIFVTHVSPPPFPLPTSDPTTPVYEPGLPALRVEHNTVRVPLSTALSVFGTGPFSVVDNHFSCGGKDTPDSFSIAETVFIMNIGLTLELSFSITNFSELHNRIRKSTSSAPMYYSTNVSGAVTQRNYPLGGAVVFTNNTCQLEARADARAFFSEFASVVIFSFDHVLFSNNQCSLDGTPVVAFMDAFLLGWSVQVTNNRFEENFFLLPVLFLSGITFGIFNMTAQNISTWCLIPYAAKNKWLTNAYNMSLLALIWPDENNPCTLFAQN